MSFVLPSIDFTLKKSIIHGIGGSNLNETGQNRRYERSKCTYYIEISLGRRQVVKPPVFGAGTVGSNPTAPVYDL